MASSYLTLSNPTDLLFYVEEQSHPNVSVASEDVYYTMGSLPARMKRNYTMLLHHGYECPITGITMRDVITPRNEDFDNRFYMLTKRGTVAKKRLEETFVVHTPVMDIDDYLFDMDGTKYERFRGYITDVKGDGDDAIYTLFGHSRSVRGLTHTIKVRGTDSIRVCGSYHMSDHLRKMWSLDTKLRYVLRKQVNKMLETLENKRAA